MHFIVCELIFKFQNITLLFLLWADYISINTKLAISGCLLTPHLVPARGIPVARGCVVWYFELLKQVSFCFLTTVPAYEYSLLDSKWEIELLVSFVSHSY